MPARPDALAATPPAPLTLDELLIGRSDRSIGDRRKHLRAIRRGEWPSPLVLRRLAADLGVSVAVLHAAISLTHAELRDREGTR